MLKVQDSNANAKSREAVLGTVILTVKPYADEQKAAIASISSSKGGSSEICSGNGNIANDEDPFDGAFTCDCNDGFGDANCSKDIAQSNINIVVGSLAGIVLVVVILAAVYKYRMVAAKRAAHDFHAELEKMLAEGEIEPEQIGDRKAIPREIRRTCVQLTDAIGEGAFGKC